MCYNKYVALRRGLLPCGQVGTLAGLATSSPKALQQGAVAIALQDCSILKVYLYPANYEDIPRKRAKYLYNKAYDALHRIERREQLNAARHANPEPHRASSRTYRAKNLEKVQAQERAALANATPEAKAIKKAYLKQWQLAHAEEIREKNHLRYEENKEEEQAQRREYYATHKTQALRASRAWRQAHPEKQAEYRIRKRARRLNAPICNLTHAEWEFIKRIANYCCVYCGKRPKRLTKDHITPLSKGGSHTASNIVPACTSCNSRKGNRAIPKPIQPMLPLTL